MAKRFIDTNIFEKEFVSTLEAPYKLLFVYYLTKCDHAGIFDKHYLKLASFLLDHNYTVEEVQSAFNGKLIDLGDKWFMPSFIKFQYSELNPENRANKSVISILESNNIDSKSLKLNGIKPLTSTLQGDKDKDKDKVQSKVKSKDKEKVEFQSPDYPEFESYLIEAMPLVNPEWTLERVSRASRLQYDTYEENGWKDGNGKQVKNWKTKAKTAISFKNPWNFGSDQSKPTHQTFAEINAKAKEDQFTRNLQNPLW